MRRRGSNRLAFVMPMVMVVALLAGMMIAIALERLAGERLALQREIASYERHHSTKGIQEVVAAWLQMSAGRPRERPVDEEGRAFSLTLPDGTNVAVSLREAQSRVLESTVGLSADERQDVEGILRILRQAVGPASHDLARPVGPVPVDMNGADPRVLEAVLLYVTQDEEAAGAMLSELLRLRDERPLERTDLVQSGIRANVENEQRLKLGQLLTDQPSLWRLMVEVEDSSRRTVRRRWDDQTRGSVQGGTRRFEGYVLIDPGSMASVGEFDQAGPFLSWEEVSRRAGFGDDMGRRDDDGR